MFKVIEFLIKVIGWVRILASPTLIGFGVGALIYLLYPRPAMLVVGISIASFGLILGILWATYIWNTTGTIWYMSRNSAIPELDKADEVRNETTINSRKSVK